jgi:hypothetical protein
VICTSFLEASSSSYAAKAQGRRRPNGIRVIPKRRDTVPYFEPIDGRGRELFALVCANDSEGIVAKLAAAPYARTVRAAIRGLHPHDGGGTVNHRQSEDAMARGHVENKKQYKALERKGMSKSRAAAIANSSGASSRGGQHSGTRKAQSRSTRARQGGTSAQKKRAGRKGGRAKSKQRSR